MKRVLILQYDNASADLHSNHSCDQEAMHSTQSFMLKLNHVEVFMTVSNLHIKWSGVSLLALVTSEASIFSLFPALYYLQNIS